MLHLIGLSPSVPQMERQGIRPSPTGAFLEPQFEFRARRLAEYDFPHAVNPKGCVCALQLRTHALALQSLRSASRDWSSCQSVARESPFVMGPRSMLRDKEPTILMSLPRLPSRPKWHLRVRRSQSPKAQPGKSPTPSHLATQA